MQIYYEIIAPNGKKSHLFGTIHLTSFDVKLLPIEVEMVFNQSERCIFEADIRPEAGFKGGTEVMEMLKSWEEKHTKIHSQYLDRLLEIIKLFYPNVPENILK